MRAIIKKDDSVKIQYWNPIIGMQEEINTTLLECGLINEQPEKIAREVLIQFLLSMQKDSVKTIFREIGRIQPAIMKMALKKIVLIYE